MSELPKWAEDEINSITDSSFRLEQEWEGTGYFLDIDGDGRLVDINFYERLPNGKHIITARVSDTLDIDGFRKGIVYTYRVRVLKAPISDRLAEYLKSNFNLHMDGVYRFELYSLEPLEDVGYEGRSGEGGEEGEE
ncbi:MAG: hypothetical protein RMJ59_05470 [Candidatus Nitrosocaldus sp.]|nr:hypothetical protein [Candidatus Nitrosocaldus sp.]MCS7141177.1 hypothetical protein [Candidatus Nitrosocaldus sp.]MDW8000217.1 hypothetical protein [Candidatus Nitrosocaldus sp.]MDW8275812.1 hypothetical protein [Candidatus Nitrosocaldus sp.]